MSQIPRTRTVLGAYGFLVVITLAVYLQTAGFDFVNYDDNEYVTGNAHVQSPFGLESVRWAFTTGHFFNWHPLTWLSHMLDYQVFGLHAGGHHLVNAAFHLANTLLLFGLLRRATGALGRSAFVAALFAVHPLHVESVAWVAERKDVLSTFFLWLTLLAYVHYVRRPGLKRYVPVLLAFALALTAKAMAVTLPCLLLLLDYWPLGRWGDGGKGEKGKREKGEWASARPETRNPKPETRVLLRLLVEKIPFFMLSGVAGVIALRVMARGVHTFPLGIRLANAAVAYVWYIAKTLWPSRLAAFYPHPGSALPAWQPIAAVVLAIVLVIVLVIVIRNRTWNGGRDRLRARRTSTSTNGDRGYLITGWLWYVVTLAPVVGLIQVGDHAVADRYAYVPSVGLFLMAAWGLGDLFAVTRVPKWATAAAAGVVIAALTATAALQARHWRDGTALFERMIAVNPNNALGHWGLGAELAKQARAREAVAQYNLALEIEPKFADAHNSLGNLLAEQGRTGEAVAHFSAALEINPKDELAHYNWANALARQGKLAEAVEQYRLAIENNPRDPNIPNNLGIVLGDQLRYDEAVACYQAALRIDARYAPAHFNLGNLLARTGKLEDAARHLEKALEINPDDAQAREVLDSVSAQLSRDRSL